MAADNNSFAPAGEYHHHQMQINTYCEWLRHYQLYFISPGCQQSRFPRGLQLQYAHIKH